MYNKYVVATTVLGGFAGYLIMVSPERSWLEVTTMKLVGVDVLLKWLGIFGGALCGCLSGFIFEAVHAWYHIDMQQRQRALISIDQVGNNEIMFQNQNDNIGH